MKRGRIRLENRCGVEEGKWKGKKEAQNILVLRGGSKKERKEKKVGKQRWSGGRQNKKKQEEKYGSVY